MVDISIGTFEIAALSQMATGGAPTVPGGTPPIPTVNISLTQLAPVEGTGPATLMISGLPGVGATVRFTSTLTLGKDYEVIFREIL
jgi:hypothetical protein